MSKTNEAKKDEDKANRYLAEKKKREMRRKQ